MRPRWLSPVADEQVSQRGLGSGPGICRGYVPWFGVEARGYQDPLPGFISERAEPVRLPYHLHAVVRGAQGELVLRFYPLIGRIRIGGPLAKTGLPAGLIGAATAAGAGLEGVGSVVGGEYRYPTTAAV